MIRYFFYTAILCLLGCESKQTQFSQNTPRKPNIIYILADDMGYGDMELTGQEKFKTPNLNRLIESGVFFSRHYSGSAVCAPSRSSLLTGLHTGHTSIRKNTQLEPAGQEPLESSAITVAEILKENGYVTGAYGKWGLGMPNSEGGPLNQGFDSFFGYHCQRLAHNYYPYHLWNNRSKEILEGNVNSKEGTYAPDLIHQKAMEYIQKNRDTTFFLYYPSIIPHAELKIPKEYAEQVEGRFQNEIPYVGIDEGPKFKNGGYGSQEKPRTTFTAMLKLLDQQVGDIINQLSKEGILDNTIIMFSSDNGPHLEGGADPEFFNSNSHLRGYKRDFYEGGIRVPFVVSWPRRIKGSRISNHPSAFWDVLPTICDIIGTECPEGMDGISFLPELAGEPQEKHDHLYWEFHKNGGKQAVLVNEWKGIRLDMGNEPNAPIELYNLSLDPSEQRNLAKEYPNMVNIIDSIMQQEHSKSNRFPFEFELSKNTKIDFN